MGICPLELQEYVIRPTLKHLGVWSHDAEVLLLSTAAFETNVGYRLLDSANKKSGFGVFCITALTHKKIWDTYIATNPDLASKVRGLASQREFLNNPDAELITNLSYATAIAWLIYESSQQPIPCSDDIVALAQHWNNHFNDSRKCNTYKEHIHMLRKCVDIYEYIAA